MLSVQGRDKVGDVSAELNLILEKRQTCLNAQPKCWSHSSWPTERKNGFVVKALHCHLKNLGLIPLATTSLCAHRQITSYLFAQLTRCKLRVITLLFLTDSPGHEEFAAVVKLTHYGLKQQISGARLLDNDFIYSPSWKEQNSPLESRIL